MESNREERTDKDYVHVLLGLSRRSHTGEKERCIRKVDKGFGDEIEIFEAQLKAIGGYWRIHKTVNARDVHKAMKHLMCNLIQHPEKASYIDSEWRTSLLQSSCIYGDKYFMLDLDCNDKEFLSEVFSRMEESKAVVIEEHKSPKGIHIITMPFDTREVCKIPNVSLLRDGYYFIKEVGEAKEER